MRRLVLVLSVGFSLVPLAAAADQLQSRADLMAIIGSHATTDDFETFRVPDNAHVNTGVSYLDATTVIAGQGPNLVHPGCSYSFLRAPLTWCGANTNGIPTKTIVTWNPTAAEGDVTPADVEDTKLFFAILMTYAKPARAFGVDLWRFDIVGEVTMEIYDPNGNLINDADATIPLLGAGSFFGWEDVNGIGAVVIKNTRFPTYYSPNIDNHTYAPLSNPPDCSAARPSTPVLWPPDHRMVPVDIVGVTDPDGNAITITYDRVMQNEPADGDQSGLDCAGASIEDGRLYLRAERDGNGRGRVYRVAFTASTQGGTCQDTVSVRVPHDRRPGSPTPDDGPWYIATAGCEPHRRADRLGGTGDPATPTTLDLRTERGGGDVMWLDYALPEEGNVQLDVYDVAGRQVSMLFHANQTVGRHRISWSTSGLKAGIYFCRLQTEHGGMTRSILVLN